MEGMQFGLTELGKSTRDSVLILGTFITERWLRSLKSREQLLTVSALSEVCSVQSPCTGAAPWGGGLGRQRGHSSIFLWIKLFLNRWFKSILIRRAVRFLV